jgi:hypothetical protein
MLQAIWELGLARGVPCYHRRSSMKTTNSRNYSIQKNLRYRYHLRSERTNPTNWNRKSVKRNSRPNKTSPANRILILFHRHKSLRYARRH